MCSSDLIMMKTKTKRGGLVGIEVGSVLGRAGLCFDGEEVSREEMGIGMDMEMGE